MLQANQGDAFILVYDDADRESFESIIRFNDFISSMPVTTSLPISQHYGGGKRRLSSKTPHLQPPSALRCFLDSWRRKPPKPHSDPTVPRSNSPAPAKEARDPGPIPKLVVGNHWPGRPTMVPREEGEELAKRLNAPFFMISTSVPGYGDRDIVKNLIPRLMYRRACGEEPGSLDVSKLKHSFATWSRFSSSA